MLQAAVKKTYFSRGSNGNRVCGSTTYLRGMCKGDGIKRRWGDSRAVVETGGCKTTAEIHVKRVFGGSVGAAATVIRKACWR